MIGLQKEILKRKQGLQLTKNEVISYAHIAKIINKDYKTARRKVESGNFTVNEALEIFEALPFRAKSKWDAFIYLFTEQGD